MEDNLLTGITVLVVEDEYLIALEAQRMIEEAGAAAVVLANTVNEIRKLLADGPQIDAAILDLKLGKEDASPVMAEFRERNIPFLIATGFDGGAPEGVPRLSKPYRDTELIAAIRHLLAKT
jgi:DNA-binding response OmpR family regulator